MRGWYEFGYDGFPTGEKRRRFYRQRDDPCDSEEEHDFDDDTNDRPVFYYPLRESEEGTSSSYSSLDESYGDSDGKVSSSEEGAPRAALGLSHRRRSGTRRQVLSQDVSMDCLLHTTLYEDMPSWYGSSAVCFAAHYLPLRSSAANEPIKRSPFWTLFHGGAPCVSPLAVSNHFSLVQWTAPEVERKRGSAEVEGGLTCCVIPDDPSLASCICMDQMHSALHMEGSLPGSAPPRFGHCAAVVGGLDTSLLLDLLSNSSALPRQRESNDGETHFQETPLISCDISDFFLSVVLGGALRLTDLSNSCSSQAGSDHRPFNCSRLLIPHEHALSHPALCLTFVSRFPTLRQHTMYIPLNTPSMSVLAPRAFATLTPWRMRIDGEAALCSYAYMGGTNSGRDPLSFFELELFQLHLKTWTWSCATITTYGAKPPPRYGHTTTAVEETTGHHLLVFGGVGVSRTYLNDLYVLDATTKVWREVFLPLGLGMPCRAFHAATVINGMLDLAFPGVADRQGNDILRLHLEQSLGFTTACTALPNAELGGFSELHTSGVDDDDVCDAAVTTAMSSNVFLILGGEANGVAVPTAWVCQLGGGGWRQVRFPLRSDLHFFHVRCAQQTENSYNCRSARSLTRSQFYSTLDALGDRERQRSKERALCSVPLTGSATGYHLNVCHGSLPHLLKYPANGGSRDRDPLLLVVGGSRSPPVSVVSQIEPFRQSLKDIASLWILMSHDVAPLPASLLSRVPFVWRHFFAPGSPLSSVAQSIWQSPRPSLNTEQSISEADQLADRMVSETVLEVQLREWVRQARKRLRLGTS